MDTEGNQLYWAAEESSVISRNFLLNFRPFTIHILSLQNTTVLKLVKPFRFWFWELTVVDSKGKNLGLIKLEHSFGSHNFVIKDNAGLEIYKISGPILKPWTFKILRNGEEIGKISKKWSGIGKEFFTDADNFNITFPSDADVKQKSILLGALFLIDIMYFEK